MCKHGSTTASRTGRRGAAIRSRRRLTAMFRHKLTTSRRSWRQLTLMLLQSNWGTMLLWASSRTPFQAFRVLRGLLEVSPVWVEAAEDLNVVWVDVVTDDDKSTGEVAVSRSVAISSISVARADDDGVVVIP
ncbi:unnamed protein product [Haemonchus placei]|uniref:Uncharacterized protein n=1 Tax=Haemonchus placei TaxID=6290 RepID=A0A0N4WZV9_HAEPC|nr:unnamed protein product [Haemonchus placei]